MERINIEQPFNILKLINILSLTIILTIKALPSKAIEITEEEIRSKSRANTVKIDKLDSANEKGTGVIIDKKVAGKDNIYTVLTVYHNVDGSGNYVIITSKGIPYSISTANIKKIKDLDLAEITFRTQETYPTMNIGNSDTLREYDIIYLSAWSNKSDTFPERQFYLSGGKIINPKHTDNEKKGYELIYSLSPLAGKGTSGGAILNEKGEMVGIHGKANTDSNTFNKNSFSAIPINKYFNSIGIPPKISMKRKEGIKQIQLDKSGDKFKIIIKSGDYIQNFYDDISDKNSELNRINIHIQSEDDKAKKNRLLEKIRIETRDQMGECDNFIGELAIYEDYLHENSSTITRESFSNLISNISNYKSRIRVIKNNLRDLQDKANNPE
jgi:Trypsin-like peptidase domain